MSDFNDRTIRGTATAAPAFDAGLRAHMLRVYNYMTGGLILTAAIAWFTANTPALLNAIYQVGANGALQPTILGWVVMLAPIGMVLLLSFRIQHMSYGAAQATFWAYAALMGASLSSILIVYTGASVATTFAVTAATFGTMSLYGYTTKRDLTGIGSFLFMGLIGVLIASLANMFFQSPMVDFVVSVIGVLVFVGLTAWDTQKIKSLYFQLGNDAQVVGKAAIMGALSLYLDFINIFLFMLRFLGDRR